MKLMQTLAATVRGRQHRLPQRVPPGETMLEVRGLSVHLSSREVLIDIDLTVRAGQIVALVGPNGAGKSTLLAAIAGDVPLSSGSIVVSDRQPATNWTRIETAMRLAVLPQRSAVAFAYTVRDVVRMARAPWAGTTVEDDDEHAIDEALASCDAAQFADRQYTTLSGGEQARASLARAFAQRAQLLLLDEPTAALDVHHQELVLDLARSRSRQGDAVVVVLHDLGLAASHADTVIVLDAGRILASGSPLEVMTTELLSAAYHHHIDVIAHPRHGGPLVLPRCSLADDVP